MGTARRDRNAAITKRPQHFACCLCPSSISHYSPAVFPHGISIARSLARVHSPRKSAICLVNALTTP